MGAEHIEEVADKFKVTPPSVPPTQFILGQCEGGAIGPTKRARRHQEFRDELKLDGNVESYHASNSTRTNDRQMSRILSSLFSIGGDSYSAHARILFVALGLSR